MPVSKTIPELLQERVTKTPQSVAYHVLVSGTWSAVTWSDFTTRVRSLAQGFRKHQMKPGCRVAIMASTSLDWECIQMAILMNGGIVVGIDAHDTADNIEHIMRTAGIWGLIVENGGLLDKIPPQVLQNVSLVVTLDSSASHALKPLPLNELQANHQAVPPAHSPSPDSPATIIFTSGTTGLPKGIQYTHDQMVLACTAIVGAFPGIRQGWRMACWLPLSNLFQRMLNLCAMQVGAETFVVGNPREIMTLLPSINPHVFIGVPRFYEKLYAGLHENVSARGVISRLLFKAALTAGGRHASCLRTYRKPCALTRMFHFLADRLVLRRIRGILGTSIQFMISGSAPMPLWLLEIFHAMGLLILEAYGISENIVPVAINTPDAFRFGSVGRPLQANEVKLSDDGEILVKGPGVCFRYFSPEESPALSDKTLNAQGFLMTGDLGMVDPDGFLFLTGRKSEIFKTSTGRRIAPTRIEESLRQSPLVDQAMVVGQGQKFVAAIVTLSEEGRQLLAGATGHSPAQPAGVQQVAEDIAKRTANLPSYQQPAGFVLTGKAFSVAGGEMTANLKLKRARIETIYAEALAKLYAEAEAKKGAGLMVQKLSDETTVVIL